MTKRRMTRDCRQAAAFAHFINFEVALLVRNRRRLPHAVVWLAWGQPRRRSRDRSKEDSLAPPRRTASVIARAT